MLLLLLFLMTMISQSINQAENYHLQKKMTGDLKAKYNKHESEG